MKPIGRVLGTLCILLFILDATVTQAALEASLDRNRAALGDTLRLTIAATEGEDLDELDLGPLGSDFEILGRSTSSKTSYVNGKFSSSKELVLDITPRREGTLAIPALRIGRETTRALTVEVGPPPKSSVSNQTLVFEAELDREEVYVQGQVILTLRLQQAINLNDRNITELRLDDAFVRPLEQNSFQRTINGRPWLVHEVRYAIFPEQSGNLRIPPQTFSARESSPRRSLFDLGNSGRLVRRSTKPMTIEVLPRPITYPDAEWLPAAEVTLEETWSTPPEQLKVGESTTRTITIRGEGLQGAQLPPMVFPATDGLKYYPDQPVISDSELPSGLIGNRVDSVAVVPTLAGLWRVPELRIPWWDTRTDELRYATLPARELQVAAASPAGVTAVAPPAPAAGPALGPDPAADITIGGDGTSKWWQLIGVVNGVGWLLTLLYLARARFRRDRPVTADPGRAREQQAFKELLTACSDSDARRARKAVIDWAAALTSRPDLASLAQVSATFADSAMDTALDGLNAVLYGSERTSWDGTALAETARRLRSARRDTSRREPPRLELYPQLT